MVFSKKKVGFPGGSVVKNLPAHAGDRGSIPGLGTSRMRRSNSAPVCTTTTGLCSGAPVPQLLKPECPKARAPQEKPARKQRAAPARRN